MNKYFFSKISNVSNTTRCYRTLVIAYNFRENFSNKLGVLAVALSPVYGSLKKSLRKLIFPSAKQVKPATLRRSSCAALNSSRMTALTSPRFAPWLQSLSSTATVRRELKLGVENVRYHNSDTAHCSESAECEQEGSHTPLHQCFHEI